MLKSKGVKFQENNVLGCVVLKNWRKMLTELLYYSSGTYLMVRTEGKTSS